MRIEIERLEAVLPATELVGVLKNEIARLLNQVEQLQREVADAKRWAMQERSQRWALPDPLSDAEREAVKEGIYLCEGAAGEANENINFHAWAKTAGVLRGLLERTTV